MHACIIYLFPEYTTPYKVFFPILIYFYCFFSDHECYVTVLINHIYRTAYEKKGFRTMQFLVQFVKKEDIRRTILRKRQVEPCGPKATIQS